MTKLDVSTLLRLQRQAYGLLLYLDRRATTEPELLSPELIDRLSSGKTAVQWLQQCHRNLPQQLVPERKRWEPFARLVASFFQTSFQVDHMELDGQLIESRIRRGRIRGGSNSGKVIGLIASAIKHVLSAENIRVDRDEARRLAERDDIRTESRVLAYVWELDRRARGKSKGAVVHRLWLSLPVSVRTSLDESVWWLAREAVINVVGKDKNRAC